MRSRESSVLSLLSVCFLILYPIVAAAEAAEPTMSEIETTVSKIVDLHRILSQLAPIFACEGAPPSAQETPRRLAS